MSKKDDELDMKGTQMGKDIKKPVAIKKSKLEKWVEARWAIISLALTNLFYLVLGASLMLIAGVAFWSIYKVEMYAPFEVVVKYASVLVGITAFYPMAKGLVRR